MKTSASTVTSDAPDMWDVVVVPFPYSDRMAEKRRPALVVSASSLHDQGYVWIAMITGAGKAQRKGDIVVRDLARAALPGASMVRTAKIATVEPSRIMKRIGTLAAGQRRQVRKAIESFLAN